MLEKVISGGQTGADEAGLEAASIFGIKTGGTMPFGYKTENGCKPEMKAKYGVTFHSSSNYPPRTRKNVADSDGTIRLAYDFDSSGERCTLRAINNLKKPHFDVDLNNPCSVQNVIEWIENNDIKILNVAGNAEGRNPGTFKKASEYLCSLFQALGFERTQNA